LLDRVFTLRNNPHFAHTIGSSRSAMRWKEWIAERRTILHSLSILGGQADVANAVLPVLYIQYLLAMADYWERQGQPTGDKLTKAFMVIDEVSNVAAIPTAADALAKSLAQASKTGVRQILATQFEAQMRVGGPALAAEMHNNIDHWLSFALPMKSKGHEAEMLDPSGKVVTDETLAGLPRYHAVANLSLFNPRSGLVERTGPF